MDDVVTRMARELSDAIAAAVAEDPQSRGLPRAGRAAGFEMKSSLEAIMVSSTALLLARSPR